MFSWVKLISRLTTMNCLHMNIFYEENYDCYDSSQTEDEVVNELMTALRLHEGDDVTVKMEMTKHRRRLQAEFKY